MVIDCIENAERYYGLGKRFRAALEWLAVANPDELISGERVEIDGDFVYATMFQVDTLPPDDCKLEAHRDYADIQYIAKGPWLCVRRSGASAGRLSAGYTALSGALGRHNHSAWNLLHCLASRSSRPACGHRDTRSGYTASGKSKIVNLPLLQQSAVNPWIICVNSAEPPHCPNYGLMWAVSLFLADS